LEEKSIIPMVPQDFKSMRGGICTFSVRVCEQAVASNRQNPKIIQTGSFLMVFLRVDAIDGRVPRDRRGKRVGRTVMQEPFLGADMNIL
jgi:hypothetical protein